jgi:hypothetical protein
MLTEDTKKIASRNIYKIFFLTMITIVSFSALVNLEASDKNVKPIRSKDLSFASNKIAILPQLSLKEKLWQDEDTIIFIHPPKTAGTNGFDTVLEVK